MIPIYVIQFILLVNNNQILILGELFIIVEYCKYGSLNSYLQKHQKNYINQIDPETSGLDTSIGGNNSRKTGYADRFV